MVVTLVFPMPFYFKGTVIDSPAYEELGWTVAFYGDVSLTCFRSGLACWLASNLSGYDGFLGVALEGGSDGLDGFDGLTTYINATIFVDCCVDSGRSVGVVYKVWFVSLAGGAGAGAVISPNLVVIRSTADLVCCAPATCSVVFVATDHIPLDGAPHGRDENFSDFHLIGQSETYRVFCEGGWLFGDVADKSACVGAVFGADGGVSVSHYREGDVFIDVLAWREILYSWFDETDVWCHDLSRKEGNASTVFVPCVVSV